VTIEEDQEAVITGGVAVTIEGAVETGGTGIEIAKKETEEIVRTGEKENGEGMKGKGRIDGVGRGIEKKERKR